MRLLKFDDQGELSLTNDLHDKIAPYAILSHTWGDDDDEVNFDDLQTVSWKNKAGYAKIRFCGEQAKKDKLEYFWVDTCCINKSNNTEYSEAINSMFRWYRNAAHCYVYLSDVSVHNIDADGTEQAWRRNFRKSRWFRRGWTLQELLAPTSVEFFSREEEPLGSKSTLEHLINEITGIPIAALRGTPLSQFTVDERMRWATKRDTKKKEDKAYCLLGVFDLFMPLIYGEGDNAFIRLNKELGTNSERSSTHWVVPRSPNTLFTGRKDILDDLERRVRAAGQDSSRSDQFRVVITGLGGQGKSEIILQLAQRVRSILWGIFWVDVSTVSQVENAFVNIAQRLHISASSWEQGQQGLANTQHSWMLVLDNADDPNVDYQMYFPPSSSGMVVLTSRNAECEQYATADYVALEGLPMGDATKLLLKAVGVAHDHRPQTESEARAVAALLQSHPLALIQAGAYVKRGHCRLADYPKMYERQRKRLLEFRPSQAQSRYRDVYATFEASMETLQASPTESSRDVLELLPLLAMCGPSQLPLILFEAAWNGSRRISAEQIADENEFGLTAWHASRLPSLMQARRETWDPFRLVEAIHTLKALALVSTNVDNGHVRVSMHPLVHAWARDRQDEHQKHTSWVAMGCIVAISHNENDIWRGHAQSLQPHIQAITTWEMGCAFASENQVAVCGILTKCGWLLHRMRDDRTLFGLLDRLCSHLGLDKCSVDQRWIEVYKLVGRNFLYVGQVRDAVRLLQNVVRIQEQALEENHFSRLESQHALAGAYQSNGQVKDAVRLLEEVVRIREQTLVEGHPDRLASQHELAGAYQSNGQVKDAVRLLKEVVRIREQTLEEDHLDRLASQHELAGAYQSNGQVKDAVRLLEEVVRIEGQTLVEGHPSRLASQYNLAIMLWDLGQCSAGRQLMRHVVEIFRRVLEPDHPSRKVSEECLQSFEDQSSECG